MNTQGYNISKKLIINFYNKIRRYIYYILYNRMPNKPIEQERENKYYALDETEFSHDLERNKLWILGLTVNTKEF